jgi:hypothetical protein
MMKHEILTHPIEREKIIAELTFFADYFIKLGYEHCELLFGCAWGIHYYETNSWEYETVSLGTLLEKIFSVEARGLGKLGNDDLFIKVQGIPIEFRFCNDSDIHILFDTPSEVTEYFYGRWQSFGYLPAEWLKANGKTSSKKLR